MIGTGSLRWDRVCASWLMCDEAQRLGLGAVLSVRMRSGWAPSPDPPCDAAVAVLWKSRMGVRFLGARACGSMCSKQSAPKVREQRWSRRRHYVGGTGLSAIGATDGRPDLQEAWQGARAAVWHKWCQQGVSNWSQMWPLRSGSPRLRW